MSKTKSNPVGFDQILRENAKDIQRWPAWMRRAANMDLKVIKRKTVDFKKYRIALAQEEDGMIVIKIFNKADKELFHYFRISGKCATVYKGRHVSTSGNPDN